MFRRCRGGIAFFQRGKAFAHFSTPVEPPNSGAGEEVRCPASVTKNTNSGIDAAGRSIPAGCSGNLASPRSSIFRSAPKWRRGNRAAALGVHQRVARVRSHGGFTLVSGPATHLPAGVTRSTGSRSILADSKWNSRWRFNRRCSSEAFKRSQVLGLENGTVAGRSTGEAPLVGQGRVVIARAKKREMGAYLPSHRAGVPRTY